MAICSCDPNTDKRRQADPESFLIRQPCQNGELLGEGETLSQSNDAGSCRGRHLTSVLFWLPHAPAHSHAYNIHVYYLPITEIIKPGS